MKKWIFLLLTLTPSLSFATDHTKTIFNGATGQPDFINRISSYSVLDLLGGATLASTVSGLATSTSNLSAQVADLRVFRSTAQVRLDNLDLSTASLLAVIKATSSANSNQFSSVASATNTLAIAVGTGSMQVSSTYTWANSQFTSAFSSIASLGTIISTTGNELSKYQISVALSTGILTFTASNTNYINLSGSTQTKTGGVILNGALQASSGTFTFLSSPRLDNIDSSTASLTTRLSNLDLSTAALTTRVNNLDISTRSITEGNATSYVNINASTQTKTGGLNVLGNVGVGTTSPTGTVHIYGSGRKDIKIESTDPRVVFYETDAGTDMKRWQNFATGGSLVHGVADDGDSSGVTYMQVFRAGNTVSSITFPTSALIGIGTDNPSSLLDVNGGSISVRGTNAGIAINGVPVSTGIVNDTAIDITASTQTKTGGLYLGGALGFQGVPVFLTYGTGNMRVGRTIGNFSGQRINVFGENAAGSGGIGSDTLVFGPQSMQNTSLDGQYNTFGGTGQMSGPSTGSFNMIVTNQSGNIRYGSGNTFYGSKINNAYSVDDPNLGNSHNQMDNCTIIGNIAQGARLSTNLVHAGAFGADATVACSYCIAIGSTSDFVGVGNSTPSSKLDVYGGSITVRGAGSAIGVVGGNINTDSLLSGASATFTTTGSGSNNIGLSVSSTAVLATIGGLVGIGTTVPLDALQIVGRVRVSSAVVGTGGCFRKNGTTNLLEWSNDCVTFSTFSTVTSAAANGWTRSGTTEIQTTNTDNVIIGAGAASRASIGLTVSQSTAPAYLQNTDIGDAKRSLSIVDEGAGQSIIALSMRSSPSGGVNNAMLDHKWVNGNDGTSKLVYSFGPNGVFHDYFAMTSSATMGVGISSPSSTLDVFNGSITVRGGSNPGMRIASTGLGGTNRAFDVFDGTFTIQQSGYVSINNPSPTRTFEVLAVDATGIVARFVGNPWSSGKTSYIEFGDNNHFLGAKHGGPFTIQSSDSMQLQDATHNVGIGTTVISSKFDVYNGSITVRGTNTGMRMANTGLGGTGRAFDVFDGTFTVLQNGRVGIGVGTLAPSARLVVVSESTTAAVATLARFQGVPTIGAEREFNISYTSATSTLPQYISLDTLQQGLGWFPMILNAGGAGVAGAGVSIGTTRNSSALDISGGSITIRGTSAGLSIQGVGTTGSAANAFFDAGGNLLKSTSSRRYKRDIQPMFVGDEYKKILSVKPITFLNVEPAKLRLSSTTKIVSDSQATSISSEKDGSTYTVPDAPNFEFSDDPKTPWVLDYRWATREPGFIAEDFDAAGLTELVTYDEQGRPDAIKYDRITTYLLEIIKDQERRISALEQKVP